MADSEINLSQSRFLHLAEQIASEDPARKYDFLTIALIQMYKVYADETKKASMENPRSAKKRAKVFRWQHSSYRYLDTISNAMVQLDIQTQPEFFISKQNKIIILLDNQPPVIISGPNNGAHKQMELAIVDEFCQVYDCTKYFYTKQEKSLPDFNQISKELGGSWTIKRDLRGSFDSDVGLTFNFDTIKNRREKEVWIARIYQELLVVLDGMEKARIKGYAIHWQDLKLEPLPVTDNAQKLTINRDAYYLKLNVPLLAQDQNLFKTLIPWLQYRFIKSENLPTIIKHSEQFFNKQIHNHDRKKP